MCSKVERSCIDCAVANCNDRNSKFPNFCPMKELDEGFISKSLSLYIEDAKNAKITMAAAETEFEKGYNVTRIEEIASVIKKMEAKKVGIATCVGLVNEARIAARIFRHHGFEVFGVSCKIGATPKTIVADKLGCQVDGKNMCNPILQAQILNEKKTEINVVIGLCAGHDSLFYKYSEALCTTLITKDKVLGHNPAAALYQTESYYSRLLE